MALPVPNPKAMLANRRYDSDSFRLIPDIQRPMNHALKRTVRNHHELMLFSFT